MTGFRSNSYYRGMFVIDLDSADESDEDDIISKFHACHRPMFFDDDEDDEDDLLHLHEDLRKHDVPFDFAINVGGDSFPVHQITLTTHSEYFRAMLAPDTKENQQGFVDMKEVSPYGVRECVEFMYSGKVKVEDETIEDILQVADMMQLANVIEKCTKVLSQMLNACNCLFVYNLATKYSFSELQEIAMKIFNKWRWHVKIPMFFQFSKEGLVEFLKPTHPYDSEIVIALHSWDCIINWIKYDLEGRNEFIHDLVKLLGWDTFPSELLKCMWAESLFKNSEKCREFLFENLFLDLDKLELNLCLENYFILKTLSNEFKYVTKQIKDQFNIFLKLNFLLLSRQPDFKLLNENEFVSQFTDEASRGIVAERWKWHAMITWIEHDHTRKKYLLGLMKTIRFDLLPRSFLETYVRNEPMVKESNECLNLIISALVGQVIDKKTETNIVVLYSDGRIRTLDVTKKTWCDVKESPKPIVNAEIFQFNGKLCLINGTKLFYLQGEQWIERKSMESDVTGKNNVATLDYDIYVGVEKRMFCYNSLHDAWRDTDLPAIDGTIVSVEALNDFVYVFTQNETHKLILDHQIWTNVHTGCEYDTKITLVMDGNIYIAGDNAKADRFDPLTGRCSNLPNITDPYRTNHGRLSMFLPKPKALLAVNGRFGVVIDDNTIYFYDEICKKWISFLKIPQLVTETKDQTTLIEMISVCTFD